MPQGTATLGNGSDGVLISTAPSNTIGGITASARNIISGSALRGIEISGAAATGNLVEGNYVGTDVTGTTALGNVGSGVYVSTASNTIGGSVAGAGNLLSGNDRVGLALEVGANANVVQGNFIGTNAAGTAALANALGGLLVNGGASNTIGGSTGAIGTLGIAAFAGNLISGNTGDGVEIASATATGNVVEGDTIGTNAAGTAAIANSGNGVAIDSGASTNTIGGLTTTPGTGAGNVISGNAAYGVEISDSGTTGNLVAGNLVGTDVNGSSAVANSSNGVMIVNTASGNTVGGTTASARNIISGNTGDGVEITGSGTSGNLVAGNYVGTDVTGTTALGNVGSGVYVSTASNTIGGSVAGAGNLLSGNDRVGLALEVGANANVVQGNFIGTNAAGSAALANGLGGVEVSGGASNTIGGSTGTIGTLGTAAFAGNLISGNTGDGVEITTATGNVVEGDYIGTDVTGTVALANGTNGVQIDTGASANTIGGLTTTPGTGAGNVISGNTSDGVEITGTSATGNAVAGNLIGTNKSGTAALANEAGVEIASGASGNTVGGLTPAPGSGAGNLISGNTDEGVVIILGSGSGNVVAGNLIGPDITGSAPLGSQEDGVYDAGVATTIGGATASARNVISGNTINGVENPGSSDVIEGNFIGTDITGAHRLGNFNDVAMIGSNNTIGGLTTTPGTAPGNVISGSGKYSILATGSGILIEGNLIGTDAGGSYAIGNAVGMRMGGTGNTVGGTALGARNIISAAGGVGVQFDGAGVQDNVIAGNYIGTDITGTVAIPNRDGVNIALGATNNTVGGIAMGAGNVISANTEDGVGIGSASNNAVVGNLIGTNAAGTGVLGNGWYGVDIQGPAVGNMIGGGTPSARNVISGNSLGGIHITLAGATGNAVEGNFIGTDVSGTLGLPNAVGVLIDTGASGNSIGGTTAIWRNVISGNTGYGVEIDTSATGNVVEGDYIGTDMTGDVALGNIAGIELKAAGNTIGGTAIGAGNVIAGNDGTGFLQGSPIAIYSTSDELIEGNLLGLDAAGAALPGATSSGIYMDLAVGVTIGGTTAAVRNVISGNLTGIEDETGSANVFEGNYIGTDTTGTYAIGNASLNNLNGIELHNSTEDTIGGTVVGTGNVLSGNQNGVYIWGVLSTGNVIEGNRIGTNASGTAAVGNTKGVFVVSTGNTIGGTAAGAGNLISGNTTYGVDFSGTSATGNVVAGNFIGTDLTGTIALGNHTGGVEIDTGATDNTIGGTTALARNIIAGTASGPGVYIGPSFIPGSNSSGNVVLGNYIGTDLSGTVALANHGDGVEIDTGTTDNVIGAISAARGTRSHLTRMTAFKLKARAQRGMPSAAIRSSPTGSSASSWARRCALDQHSRWIDDRAERRSELSCPHDRELYPGRGHNRRRQHQHHAEHDGLRRLLQRCGRRSGRLWPGPDLRWQRDGHHDRRRQRLVHLSEHVSPTQRDRLGDGDGPGKHVRVFARRSRGHAPDRRDRCAAEPGGCAGDQFQRRPDDHLRRLWLVQPRRRPALLHLGFQRRDAACHQRDADRDPRVPLRRNLRRHPDGQRRARWN